LDSSTVGMLNCPENSRPEGSVRVRVPRYPLMRKKPAKHWYRQYIGECPVCGRDSSFKERVYGDKPKDMKEVYKQLPDTQTYCGCLDHE
jgi:hypothetical protein